jgi:transcription initiation factor IIE alpha subunit
MTQQSIPCPDCGTKIYFDAQMLLQGAQFTCTHCGVTLGLAPESKEVVEQSLEKFGALKSELLKNKGTE